MKKNFKRLLCLVLVVSLVCTLGVTAFASSSLSGYTDVDEITYVEAVDVLTGIGILEGTDGAFNGSENMTRAQAAKIIAYLALGADTASSLSATSAPFDDVPLTHWAVGYIAYCASAGIIDGDGTGNFNPEDEVTAYQFGKMLLCTLGYGVNGEYTGASWAVNVAASAGSLGIYSGKEGSLSGNVAITRDEMALYTFNTLTGAAKVNYNSNFGEYYVGISALNSISTTIKDSYKYEAYIDSDANDETAYEYTIGYQTYDLVKSGEKGNLSKADAFGRPSYKWEADGVEVSDEYTDDTPDYTFTGKQESQDVYSEIGKTIAGYEWTYYIDGEEDYSPLGKTDTGEVDSAGDTIYANINPTKNSSATMVARGETMELYVDDSGDGSVTAIIINTYLAQVDDVDADGSEIELTLDVYLTAKDSGSTSMTIDETVASNLAAFAEDDWVIVTYSESDDELQSVAKATVVEGVATAYNAGNNTTVDGTKYNWSDNFGFGYNELYSADDYDGTYIYYLDVQGNIIGYEESDESTSTTTTKSYLYVMGVSADVYDGFDDAEVKVKVEFTDGTISTVYLKVNDADTYDEATVKIAGTTYNLQSSGDITTVENALYNSTEKHGYIFSYSVNSSGYYTLSEVKDADDTGSGTARQAVGVTVDDGTTAVVAYDDSGATLRTFRASSSTKLILVEDGVTYTGYTNFPDETWMTSQTLFITTSAGGSKLSYINVFGDDASASGDYIYAMYKGSEGQTSDYYQYSFWVNGEAVIYDFDETLSLTKYNAVWLEQNSDGTYDLAQAAAGNGDSVETDYEVYVGVVTNKSSDSIEVENNGVTYYFSLADGYEKTRIKANGSPTSSAPSEDDYVWVFVEDALDTSNSAEAVAVFAVDPSLSAAGITGYVS